MLAPAVVLGQRVRCGEPSSSTASSSPWGLLQKRCWSIDVWASSSGSLMIFSSWVSPPAILQTPMDHADYRLVVRSEGCPALSPSGLPPTTTLYKDET